MPLEYSDKFKQIFKINDHVIWDKRGKFNQLNLINRSAILELKDQKLVAIIEIYLDTKLNNLLPSHY